jgi:hypothetical protein
MLLNGHVLKACLCFVLHLTLIGWIPAAIWGWPHSMRTAPAAGRRNCCVPCGGASRGAG